MIPVWLNRSVKDDEERRARMYAGEIFVYDRLSSVSEFANFTRRILEAALAPHDPRHVHETLTPAELASILGRLSQRGVAADRLGRLKAPAGLDLGAVTPVEIAISILAEIVQHHRSDKTVEAEAPSDTTTPTEAIDPICGMSVEIASVRY